MLPALEADVILNDRFTSVFDTLDAKVRRTNRTLGDAQGSVLRLQNYLSMLDINTKANKSGNASFFDAGGAELGIQDVLKKLPAGVNQGAQTFDELADSFSEYMDQAKAAEKATESLADNLEALGDVDIGETQRELREVFAGLHDVAQRKLALAEEMAKPMPSIFDREVPLMPALRALDSLPMVQIPALSALQNILPTVTVRTVALAAGFAGLGAAGAAAVAGLDALWSRMAALEVQGNLKQKIGVTFETTEVDAAITQVQDDLDDRLSKEKVMQILLTVDPTSALADLDKFGALAAVVQGYADAFGLSWEQSFQGISEAIQDGNGQYLEQVGAIDSADGAYLRYAKSQGKNVAQLTALDKQQALYNATLEKLSGLADPAASSTDKLREATEQSKAAFSDASVAFGDWVVALLDPTASGMADWWAGKLTTMTGIIRDFEAQLTASASEARVTSSLSPEDAAAFDALRTRRDQVSSRLDDERANLAIAEDQGSKTQIAAAQGKIDELEARLNQLNDAIELAKDNAINGIPISPVVSGSEADQATLDSITDRRAALVQEIADARSQMSDAAFSKDNVEYYRLVGVVDELEARLSSISEAADRAIKQATGAQTVDPFAPTFANEETFKIQADYAKKLKDEQMLLVLSTLAVKQAQDELSAEDFAAAFNAGDTETLDKSQAGVDKAAQAKSEAEARYQLIQAEQAYLLAKEQVKLAEKDGYEDLIARNQANLAVAASTLELAQQQVVAVGELDAYAESVKRVGNAFDEAKTIADASAASFVPVDQWQAAIDAFRTGMLANPVVIPTVVGPPTQEDQTATNPGNSDTTRFDEETALTASTAATAAATELAVAASNALLAARNATKAATTEVKNAEDALAIALASGTASQQTAAQTALNTAKTKQLSAQESAKAALAEYEAAKAALLSATAHSTNATANENSAQANKKAAQATEQNADALQETAQVAGLAVDAVSGLPVAFNAAELNAKQLEAALVDLEIQLMNIESAAANVGFSIAQRLVPQMGITGALQKGTEWAGQARQIREAVDAQNEMRLANGEDPLGAQYLDYAMGALTDNWQAYATDATAAMDTVGSAGKSHADEMSQVADQINDALDGMVRGVLKDSTSGLIDLDSLLPRIDAVDENARRMADVAVKGFQSPWYEGLKSMFAPEVFEGGEQAVKTAAANMVREHQKGLTMMLYDADAAAKEVFEQIQAKQKTDEFVAEIREKVKAMGANVEGFDIKNALGIELNEDDVAQQAGGAARKSAMSQVLAFDEIMAQIQAAGAETKSPLVELMEPKEADNEKLKSSGKNTLTIAGDAMVTQATDGKYGEKSINAIVTQLKSKETDVKAAGVTLADWLGGSMVTRFENNVPAALLEILVTNLIPLMVAQQANEKERESAP